MFIGHYAPALAAAALTRRSPRLGTLFVAAQLVDIAFFVFLLIGVEHMRIAPGFTAMNPMDLYDMPWTHSLAGALGWAAGFGLVIWLLRRDAVAALVGGSVVLSHWLLDLLVHGPDLTLIGSPPRFGLGLWNHPAIEMPLETLLWAGALVLYLRRTRGGTAAPAVLAIAMALFAAIGWSGPKPTEMSAMVSIEALFGYTALSALAWWVAKSRKLT